jgi:hypothetical protein
MFRILYYKKFIYKIIEFFKTQRIKYKTLKDKDKRNENYVKY